MCSLLMSPFSRDFLNAQLIALRYLQCYNSVLACQQYLHSTWFFDGRASRLVVCLVILFILITVLWDILIKVCIAEMFDSEKVWQIWQIVHSSPNQILAYNLYPSG